MNDFRVVNLVGILGPIITLVVGGFIFWQYKIQKRDEKKQAARIIYMEIEKAEKNLIPIKAPITTSNILERKFLLPESSRQKYKHLLARDFSTRELEIIDSFYETCQIIDSETIRYKRFYDQYQEEKAREIQRKIVELADRCENEEEYKLNLKKITDLCHAETYFYVSTITEKRIAQYLQVVPNLINTPVGEKIKGTFL